MKKYLGLLLIIACLVLLVYSTYKTSERISNMDQQLNTTQLELDSLRNELFISKTIVDRYQITLEWFKVENPRGAEQFEQGLSQLE